MNAADPLTIPGGADEYVLALHREGFTVDEIADAVNRYSLVRVSPDHVTTWLYDHGYPACTAVPDGRSMCERPARPGTNPPRCSADDRSNR